MHLSKFLELYNKRNYSCCMQIIFQFLKKPLNMKKSKKNWGLIEKLKQTRVLFPGKNKTTNKNTKTIKRKHFQKNNTRSCPEVKFLSPWTDRAHNRCAHWKTKLSPSTVKLQDGNRPCEGDRIKLAWISHQPYWSQKGNRVMPLKFQRKKTFTPKSSN